ncbi:unnamed protein product [Vitrella brassicaformis CCMP3155]|uniref:TLDc domain-containing protein n=1 Tax=Vitrella brassicaformis (strain CCMP3155) TaxID=1169540 RepID=A0A0G4FHT0_VITBC|nr:unnamed protein product [Vitrella brassicaformis CCMP3155]|eukprot:CEM13025.1 unnamed protein product [Vitrella brassicaformis CCMP3155]
MSSSAAAVASAYALPSHHPTSPLPGLFAIEEHYAALQKHLTETLKHLEEGREVRANIIKGLGGRPDARGSGDDVLEINAGGTVLKVQRSTLTCVEDSLVAELFSGVWDANFLRDPHNRMFINCCGECFAALVDDLVRVELGLISPSDLTTKAPPSNIYFPALLRTFTGVQRTPTPAPLCAPKPPAASNEVVVPACSSGVLSSSTASPCRFLEDVDRCVDTWRAEKGRLMGVVRGHLGEGGGEGIEEAFKERIAAVHDFFTRVQGGSRSSQADIETGRDDDSASVVSVEVMGRAITTTTATLRAFGEENSMYNRFVKWSNKTICKVPHDAVAFMIEACRRLHLQAQATNDKERESPIVLPSYPREHVDRVKAVFDMYGGPYGALCLPPKGSSLLTSREHLYKIRQWMGLKPHDELELIYKSSRDGHTFDNLMSKVIDRSPLLLLAQRKSKCQSDSLVGVAIDAPLPCLTHKATIVTVDPSCEHFAPVLFSLQPGPFKLACGDSKVTVRGTEWKGSLTDGENTPHGLVEFFGCLIMGCGDTGSKGVHDNLTRCYGYLRGDSARLKQPAGWPEGNRRLFGSPAICYIDEVEVFTLEANSHRRNVTQPRPSEDKPDTQTQQGGDETPHTPSGVGQEGGGGVGVGVDGAAASSTSEERLIGFVQLS